MSSMRSLAVLALALALAPGACFGPNPAYRPEDAGVPDLPAAAAMDATVVVDTAEAPCLPEDLCGGTCQRCPFGCLGGKCIVDANGDWFYTDDINQPGVRFKVTIDHRNRNGSARVCYAINGWCTTGAFTEHDKLFLPNADAVTGTISATMIRWSNGGIWTR